MALTGTIPPHLGNLSFLVYLNLSRNNFHGNLPDDLGRLHRSQVLDFGVNNLTREIPSTFGSLQSLRFFSVANNSFSGFVPISIYNISSMEHLWLHFNYLQGTIPLEVGNLLKLKEYILFGNNLWGPLPAEIFNISTLEWISLGMNHLSGSFPKSICRNHERLYRFTTSENMLSGPLPSSFSNCSQLQLLSLSTNNHSGAIPKEYGNMKDIKILNFGENYLTGEIPKELGNATTLEKLLFQLNQLTGCIPDEIGHLYNLEQILFSSNLLTTGSCNIKNRIPDAVGNLSSLIHLGLYSNRLSGEVPSTIRGMQMLQTLDVGDNELSTISVEGICNLPRLFEIDMSRNQLSSSIPDCLGNITTLRYILMQRNRFINSIPKSLWNLQDLLVLNLSSNLLSGSLPREFGNLKMATRIDLSMNQLFGDLPNSTGDIQSLQILRLDDNQFQGSIPESLSKMLGLESLNLSHNKLSGLIPNSLESLQHLKYFNVSFNYLSGEIPSGGPFENLTLESFLPNEGLCGEYRFHVPQCPTTSSTKLRGRKVQHLWFVLVGIVVVIGVITLGAIFIRCRRKDTISNQTNVLRMKELERISYYELVQATNGYDESNLLGKGSIGSVYKGTLNDGRIFAVKVFNLQVKGASESFQGECEVLRNLHHRNLTKVISSCSNLDFKALVLEFLPNGSLEKWLYAHNYYLNVIQRLNIMIDVAAALCYLHFGYSEPVVHCDLKPSNVLLDQDMVAHVTDFGIAKILGKEESMTYTKTLATFGYVAPEYGLEGLVSTKCDIYSFGIVLMEVFTRTRPNDEMFKDNLSLKVWVSNFFPNSLPQVLDSNLIAENEEYITEKLECIASIIEVALNCSRESPKERSTIIEVIAVLEKIKLKLLPYYERV